MTESKEEVVEVVKDFIDPFDNDAPAGVPQVEVIGSTCTACEG